MNEKRYWRTGLLILLAIIILALIIAPFIVKKQVVEQLYLKGLTTHIIQYDSIFNFTDLLEFHQSEPDSLSEHDTSASEPFQYDFSELELNQAHFSYTAASIDNNIYMRDFGFYTPQIAWNQDVNGK